jgi:hypothetical protein
VLERIKNKIRLVISRLPINSKLPALLTLLALLIALPATVLLVKRQQNYLGQAAQPEDSKYGMNIFKNVGEPKELDEAHKRKTYEYLQDAGIKWLRDGDAREGRSITSWQRIEPEKGNWQWEKVDEDLALFQEYGFAYLGWVGDPPNWAELKDTNYPVDDKTSVGAHPNNLDDFAKYVKQLVSRYGCNGGTCQIKYWEVGNEPNNNGYYRAHPESYAALLKIAYETIKTTDSNAIVVLGGLGSEGIKSHPNFHKDIFEKYQAAKYFDIFNFHAYGITKYNGGGEAFGTLLDRGLAIRNKYCPQKPVWLTETASWSGNKGSDWQSVTQIEKKQATDLQLVRLVVPFNKGIEKVFWFRYKDGANPTNLWGTVGIFKDNLNPKPAYFAYQTKTNSGPPPTKISGLVWIDTNGNGLQEIGEKTYTCSGTQTKIKLSLYTIGNTSSPSQEKELSSGIFAFNNLAAKKYRLRISQMAVCNGVLYEPTKWRIDTAPSLKEGWRIDISNYVNNGTTTDASDAWNTTPFWSLNVLSGETTHVYLGIKPSGATPPPSEPASPTPSQTPATPTPTPTPSPLPTPTPTPTLSPVGSITGFLWVDTNGNGKQDGENTYSCSGTQTRPKLALYQAGTPDTPFKTMTLSSGDFTFNDLTANKYHLKISQMPVCNGVQYQVTKWRIITAPSDGSLEDVSEYDGGPGTKADATDTWTTLPYWCLKVNNDEMTRVYLGIKPK